MPSGLVFWIIIGFIFGLKIGKRWLEGKGFGGYSGEPVNTPAPQSGSGVCKDQTVTQKEECENCRFYFYASRLCRRRSPVIHPTSKIHWFEFEGIFLRVTEGDWCGEWEKSDE